MTGSRSGRTQRRQRAGGASPTSAPAEDVLPAGGVLSSGDAGSASRSRAGRRTALRSLLALVVTVASLVVAPSAFAGLALGVGPTFPTPVTVGQTNVPASLQLSNVSTPPESGGTVSVTQIQLVPACGSSDPSTGDCPLAQADPGVFTLSPTATGEAGTACQGMNFVVTVTDPATGQVQFVPVGGAPVVLTAPGTPNSVCRIDFTVSVNKAPVHPNAVLGPNSLRTYVLAHVIASPSTAPAPAPETGNQPVIINKAAPGLTTTATPTAPVGSPITDTAHLTAASPPGPAPTGTITFNLYSTAGCGGVPVFTSTVPVNGVGDYTSAPPFTPTAPGSYFWTAAYSGDLNNAAMTTACGDNNETAVITKAAPAIVTHASPTVAAGNPITDTATLSGGVNPTGNIVFTLFGPNDTNCTAGAIFTSTVPVNAGNGNYTSGPFTPTLAGTYRWVAVYSGDANNAAVTSPCNAANEAVVVSPAQPAIVTQASPTVAAGNPITDTATLSGGVNPTGNIVFTLFGPNDTNCSGGAIFTSTRPVAGNGNYTSGPFTPTLAGTYRWVAVYSGDANNAAVTSPCNAANEAVVVSPAQPAIVTQASPTVRAGNPITDTATLSGGVNPTGTITFTLFGPNNVGCTGAAIFTSTRPVAGNGNYTSGPFTPTLAGTYRWVAVYSGDANNATVTSSCNAANEAVVVSPAQPAIVTQAS
ncbi:MAG: hypothetical protein QOF77_292, partial [Solirubrobacteraceae bacterium]|nr:hypothetical protein [Solirubrobacteraceae bacterium]